jgi:Domain of unknown function (DUF4157)
MSDATFARRAYPPALNSTKSNITHALGRAASEPGHPIDPALRSSLQHRFAQDFSRVKVHSGPASAESADRIGARAYTLGTDIHLGAEAAGMGGREFSRLLVHEAVHTLQQGGRQVSPHAGLNVSKPTDGSEQEAKQIADSFTVSDPLPNASHSLALRDKMRAGSGQPRIANMVAPQLQRDLTGKKAVDSGEFDLDMKTESHPGARSGMQGIIKFTASEKAPDSSNIRLLQVIKVEDLTTGKDFVWTGAEANRNRAMTTASQGVEAGHFVDVSYAGISPRSKKTDPAVSPYYRDYWPNPTRTQDGSKKGKTVKEASLGDYPGSNQKFRFCFETAAKGADTGHIYATLTWGFTISDPAKGTVDHEHAAANRDPSATLGAAVTAFEEFFKNPGSSTAP